MTREDEIFNDLVAVVEIPAGTDVKLELDAASGNIEPQRRLPEKMRYPVNYGFVPGTLAGDGDPLDVLVVTRTPLESGTVITVRPIAVMRMQDTGRSDPKVVVVPSTTSAAGPSCGVLPDELRQRIEEFFQHYKDDPATGRSPVILVGWKDVNDAKEIIAHAVEAFVDQNSPAARISAS